MRIVHVVRSDGFAGVERSILGSAAALTALGHDVAVIGGRAVEMTAGLQPLGVPWSPASTTAAAARALRRLPRPDVIHAHMTAAELAVVISGCHRRSAFVTTRHFAHSRGGSLSGRVAARMIEAAHPREIAISHCVARLLPGSPDVVYHAVENRPLTTTSEPCVVVIQRLEPEKDTATALRAWGASDLADQGWVLRIAGDGSERPTLEALAASLGLRSVEWLGHVAAPDELRLHASIHLATTPNEGFGLAAAESMAWGLPVVMAAGGAHPELAGELADELLFAPGNAGAAAGALAVLARDLERRREVGRQLQLRQQAQFSVDSHGNALDAIYRDLIRARERPDTKRSRR